VYAVNIGFARGYAANGDFSRALEYAEKALKQAANNEANKKTVQEIIIKLKVGKEVN
jgi:hypothetical protein